MAFKISGSTIIDDSRNIVNAGVVSATSISANEFIGTGDNLIFLPSITSFSPTDGATDVAVDTNIILTFDQRIYAGVGSVFLRNSSGIGTIIEAIGISSSMINNQTLTINPISDLPTNTDVYIVLPQGVITNAIGGNIATVSTYNFTTENPPPSPALGSAIEGGYVICCSGGTRWIVAPASTEVSRTWYCRDDAVTTANANAACGDWFVPTCGQLQNPGYTCRTYWDSYTSAAYWSSTEYEGNFAYCLRFNTGYTSFHSKSNTYRVRAFRCVTY